MMGDIKARLVAGGHLTDPATTCMYSSVVGPEGIRLVIFLADDNSLDLLSGDVGNTFLYSKTREKIWVKLGPEFGPGLAGRIGIFVKGLDGLKTSGARWSEDFANNLRNLGWTPSNKAKHDVWIKDCNSHYEYLAVYVDDILVASKDQRAV
jgi:hypothetical protein